MPRIRPQLPPAQYNPVSGDTGSLFPPSGGGGALPPAIGGAGQVPPPPDFASLPQMAGGPVDDMGTGGLGIVGGGGPPVPGQSPVSGMPGGGAGGGVPDPMRDALMQILGNKVRQPGGPPMPGAGPGPALPLR